MRLILFIGILFLSTFIHPLLLMVLVVGYTALFPAYELLLLALLLDAYYGSGVAIVPLYTSGCVLLLLSAEYIKPKLQWYQ